VSPRRLIPVVVLALTTLGGAVASAQEEAPILLAAPPPKPPPRLHLQVGGDGGYLRALGQSFGGGAVDVRVGAGNQIATLAFRVNGLLGRSAGGLSFERALGGFQAQFHLSERVRFGLSLLNGIFVYQRAIAVEDRHVYAWAMGLLADLDVELVRGKSTGALVLTTSLGYEYISAVPERAGDTFSGQFGLAWRY